jgi:uncharacterized protein (TIGR03437 family)
MLTIHRRHALLYLLAVVISLLMLLVWITLRARPVASSQTLTREQQEQQARAQRLQDLDTKMKNPGMLLFRAAEFDPRAAAPPAVRVGGAQLEMVKAPTAQVAAAGEASYLIVQFDSAIKPAQTDSLRARGYEIKAYIPNNAYIIKAPRTQQAQLLANRTREFRWVGAYGAGLKVQPELAQLATNIAEQTSDSADEVTIAFVTFSGEKAARCKAALAALNLKWPSDVIERFDGITSGRVVATRAEVSQIIVTLANLEGIEWIEQSETPKPENDNAVRIIQAGPNSTDTPLYRNGLTGTGQVIGIADSGLDTDHAQFRLSGDASAQTLSFATTTQDLVNGALRAQVTNPNNKVLTYYLLGFGSLIDNTSNPNGGKTLDPNEQTGSTYRNAVAYDDSNGYHGTHVTSVALGRDYAANGSGAVPGIANRTSNDGAAPNAKLVFQDVGHPAGQLNGLSVGQALIMQQAYSTGVHIHSQSWGGSTNPSYNSQSADDDDAMWRLRDFNIFFSAGNSGPSPATITKDTKNGILVARTGSPTNGTEPENLISSSSHGPTRDGRIKPDIAAPGYVRAATELTGVASSFTYSTSTTANDAAVNPVAPNGNRDFSGIGGTSFSSPLAAGGAALVREYFEEGFYPTGARNAANGFNPSNALIKAIVLNSGRNMTGTYTANDGTGAQSAPLPNFGQGWGRMTLDDPLFFAGDRRELRVLADIWNGATASDATRPAPNAAITTGQTHNYQITNVSTIEPLRITLVWADPKAAIGATVALINNLNLEVTDPAGNVYRGNVNFKNAWSQPAGSLAADDRNPLEAVYFQYPAQGTYTIKVIGASVPGNGQFGVVAQPGNQTIDSNRQGYALVATGNFSTPLTRASVTTNGASFTPAETTSGALASSFGSGFPNGTNINAAATSLPLPTTLNGVTVNVNGQLAPLLYVGVGTQFGGEGAFQINYQLPFETTSGTASVVVAQNGTPITTELLAIRTAAPGVFSMAQNGQGQGAVLNQNNASNNSSAPEARGRVLQVYATGTGNQLLNSITRQPITLASGIATPIPTTANDPLYITSFTPTVTIGGVAATVEFSGLAPGFVGLWQLNIRIPVTAPTGNAVPLLVTAGGRTGNQTTVAIN